MVSFLHVKSWKLLLSVGSRNKTVLDIRSNLQEVQGLVPARRWQLVEMLTDEEGKFVRVLYDGRDTCCSAPVVVQVALLVRKQLHLIWRELAGVIHDVVAGRCDSSLADGLAH